MKLLLTSAGIKNASIHDALVDLLLGPHVGEEFVYGSPPTTGGDGTGSSSTPARTRAKAA